MNHNYTVSHGEISLIPMVDHDFEAYRLLRNRNNIFFLDNHDISFAQQEAWVKKYQNDCSVYMFSIIHSELGWIGGNSIYNVDMIKEEAEYGRFILDKEITKEKKYGVLCTRLAMRIAKEFLKLKKLYLSVYANNIRALKVYLQAGFVCTSTIISNNQKMFFMEEGL